MAEKVQTPKEDEKEISQTPEIGTAEEKETLEKKTTEPEIDYMVKFRESQKEGVRLAKKVKELEEKIPPETTEKVETETEGETLDQIVEKKVREKVAPFTIEAERKKVDSWLESHPESYDYLKQIEDNYMDTPGTTAEEKLENALLIAKKDAMKEAGKKEMAFSIYQKEQAVASGGGASSSAGEGTLPLLSNEEKQVALSMGLTEEAYAKRKLESTKK